MRGRITIRKNTDQLFNFIWTKTFFTVSHSLKHNQANKYTKHVQHRWKFLIYLMSKQLLVIALVFLHGKCCNFCIHVLQYYSWFSKEVWVTQEYRIYKSKRWMPLCDILSHHFGLLPCNFWRLCVECGVGNATGILPVCLAYGRGA